MVEKFKRFKKFASRPKHVFVCMEVRWERFMTLRWLNIKGNDCISERL